MTCVGRVCGVSDSSAPSVTTVVRVEVLDQPEQLAAEPAPAHVRLDAADEHEVEVGAGRAAVGQPGRRPGDPPGDAVDQRHRRPVDLEVVVVVGIDLGQRLGVPDQLEMLDRARRRVAGVVPALEGGDDDGVGELGPPAPVLLGHGLQPNYARPADGRFVEVSAWRVAVCSTLFAVRPTVPPQSRNACARHRPAGDAQPGSPPARRHRRPDGRPRRARARHRRRDGHDGAAAPAGRGGLPRRAVRRLAERPARQQRPAGADPTGRDPRHPHAPTSTPAPTSSRPTRSTRTRVSLADYGMQDFAYEMNVAAARLAREACDEATARTPDKPRWVAGAIGPMNRTGSISPDVNDPGARNIDFDDDGRAPTASRPAACSTAAPTCCSSRRSSTPSTPRRRSSRSRRCSRSSGAAGRCSSRARSPTRPDAP